MPYPPGKVNPYELTKLVFPFIDRGDERVLVGPDVGVDASVVELEEGVLVLSCDPITGALEDPGWLSVHANANDVAAMGARPEWFLVTLFLPEDAGRSDIRGIMEGVRGACEGLGVSLVGGHTEVTPGVGRVILSGAMVGEAPPDRWVSARGARPGDRIIITKSAAIEGTFILASDRGEELRGELGGDLVEGAKGLRDKLSVVDDALTAIESGGVHAMHDLTEGGLVGGLHELCDASQVGFSIDSERIPVAEETREICRYFGIDPLRTISSGSLLICASAGDSEGVVNSLVEEGINAREIGEILEGEGDRRMDGEEVDYPEQDELWKIF